MTTILKGRYRRDHQLRQRHALRACGQLACAALVRGLRPCLGFFLLWPCGQRAHLWRWQWATISCLDILACCPSGMRHSSAPALTSRASRSLTSIPGSPRRKRGCRALPGICHRRVIHRHPGHLLLDGDAGARATRLLCRISSIVLDRWRKRTAGIHRRQDQPIRLEIDFLDPVNKYYIVLDFRLSHSGRVARLELAVWCGDRSDPRERATSPGLRLPHRTVELLSFSFRA